jgi:hypothetical protein
LDSTNPLVLFQLSGECNFIYLYLAPGPHNISAAYNGDINNDPSLPAPSVSQDINAAPTAVAGTPIVAFQMQGCKYPAGSSATNNAGIT